MATEQMYSTQINATQNVDPNQTCDPSNKCRRNTTTHNTTHTHHTTMVTMVEDHLYWWNTRKIMAFGKSSLCSVKVHCFLFAKPDGFLQNSIVFGERSWFLTNVHCFDTNSLFSVLKTSLFCQKS
jgi:hypothetical protein